MEQSRFGNSVRNVLVAWCGQGVSILLSFVTRGVFAALLSMEYMGLENLFSSVLTMLCLADLGIGSAIIFALYDPIAKNDVEKVKALMRVFRIAYTAIGVVIALVGFALAPFVSLFIQDAPDIPYLSVYFLCFVLNTAISYFFSYKGSLIYAHQKNYVVVAIQYGFQIAMYGFQIVVLFATHNYFLFLATMMCSTLLQNIVIAKTADRMFPYLKSKDVARVDKETMSGIRKNTFALVLHKVSGALSVSSGSLFVSAFVGINAVAMYGSYMMVINSLSRVMDKAFDAITASVGNLGVAESVDRQYSVFKTSFFINALAYCVLCSGLLCCFNPLVEVWLGEDYEFPVSTVALFVVWFYMKGIRGAEQSFTSAYGLYWFSRYKAVAETASLIVLSYVLVMVGGIDGVLVAGIVTMGGIAMTIEVYVLYKHGFRGKSVRDYAARFFAYMVCSALLCALSYWLCSLISLDGIFKLMACGVVSVSVSLVGFLLAFRTQEEFRDFVRLARRLAGFSSRRGKG